jgi:transposase
MKAYSEDLRRKKVVEAVQQRGTSKSEAARLFSISLSSLKRYTHKARFSGRASYAQEGRRQTP